MKEDVLASLGAPDLKFAGLELWVHGYQFPDAEDAWDGNWLRVTAHCGAAGASVWAMGAFLDTVAIRRFADGLAAMHDTLSGAAELGSDEPDLSVRVDAGNHTGHVSLRVEITPDQMHQQHVFRFDADQSFLPAVIKECRRLLGRYPIRGAANRGI